MVMEMLTVMPGDHIRDRASDRIAATTGVSRVFPRVHVRWDAARMPPRRPTARVPGFATLALLIGLVACTAPGPHTPPTPQPPVTATVKAPVGLAAAGDALWAVSSADGAVVRVDPVTGAVGAVVPVGRTPLRAAADGNTLWVSVFGAGHVVAVDLAAGKVVHDEELGGGPEGIGVAFGSVWVVRQDARVLTQLDMTGVKVADLAVGTMPRLLAFGRTTVWVSDFAGGTVTRVDPVSGQSQTTTTLCQGPQGLTVDAGVVWVACTTSNEVVAVDEQTLAVRGRVPVPGEPDAIRVADGRVWVAATEGPTLVQLALDPNAPAVLSTRKLGEAAALRDRANVDLVAAGGRLWVSHPRENRLYGVS
jgi:hypothetical protein